MVGKDNEWQGALAAIDQSSIEKLKALKSDPDPADSNKPKGR